MKSVRVSARLPDSSCLASSDTSRHQYPYRWRECVVHHIVLHGLLEQQPPDAITEHTEDSFQRFAEDLRQEVSGVFALQITAVELNRLFHELALATASILPVEAFDRRLGFRHKPERKLDFPICHANFPPILCVTPLFSLKQRDYLRFRPQWGCFCPLNN